MKTPIALTTIIQKVKAHPNFNWEHFEQMNMQYLNMKKLSPTSNVDTLIRAMLTADVAKNGHHIVTG